MAPTAISEVMADWVARHRILVGPAPDCMQEMSDSLAFGRVQSKNAMARKHLSASLPRGLVARAPSKPCPFRGALWH